MKIFKILFVMLALLFVVSVASASVKMDVYPSEGIDKNQDFLVFGYVNDGNKISSDDLEIRIYDHNGDLYKKVEPYFYGTYGNNYDYSGFFYKKVSIGTVGKYEVNLKVNGYTESSEKIDVKSLPDKETKITNLDYSISGNYIEFYADVKNTDTVKHSITVYLKGENNFNTPRKMTVSVAAGDTERVSETFSLSDFGSGEFIVAAYAKTESGDLAGYSEPDYVIVDSYYNNNDYGYNYDYNYNYDYGYYYPTSSGNVAITAIDIQDQVFYPGDVVDGTVTIQNYGSYESQYRFDYIVNNQVFKKGDVGYVESDYTATEPIAIEVPNADSFKVTARVYGYDNNLIDSMEKTFLVSQKLKYFSPYLSADTKTVTAGENATIALSIRNKGNLNDTYKIDLEGWDKYTMQNEVSVEPGKEKSINITFEVPAEAYVKTYPVIIDICNTQDVCRTKNFELKVEKSEALQSSIVWNDSQNFQYFEENETLNYNFAVTNLELTHKDYVVSVGAKDADVKISADSFTLAPNESKEVAIGITPAKDENITAAITVKANGEPILEKDIKMEYTKDKKAALGLTGFAFFETSEVYRPGLFILAAIGAVALVFLAYRFVRQGMEYQQAKMYETPRQRIPAQPSQIQRAYPGYNQQLASRPLQLAPQQPEGYSPDSFMRQM
jgi:uncharacterized membrane protein